MVRYGQPERSVYLFIYLVLIHLSSNFLCLFLCFFVFVVLNLLRTFNNAGKVLKKERERPMFHWIAASSDRLCIPMHCHGLSELACIYEKWKSCMRSPDWHMYDNVEHPSLKTPGFICFHCASVQGKGLKKIGLLLARSGSQQGFNLFKFTPAYLGNCLTFYNQTLCDDIL